jgi:hypothetical protein
MAALCVLCFHALACVGLASAGTASGPVEDTQGRGQGPPPPHAPCPPACLWDTHWRQCGQVTRLPNGTNVGTCPQALVFSVGFDSDMVLQRAPAKAAVYGQLFQAGSSDQVAEGTSVVVTVSEYATPHCLHYWLAIVAHHVIYEHASLSTGCRQDRRQQLHNPGRDRAHSDLQPARGRGKLLCQLESLPQTCSCGRGLHDHCRVHGLRSVGRALYCYDPSRYLRRCLLLLRFETVCLWFAQHFSVKARDAKVATLHGAHRDQRWTCCW